MLCMMNKKSKEKIIFYLSQTESNNIQDYTIFHIIINWKYKIKTFLETTNPISLYSEKISDFDDTLL